MNADTGEDHGPFRPGEDYGPSPEPVDPRFYYEQQYGGIWRLANVHPNSPLAHALASYGPGEIYDPGDGEGWLYKWEWE